MTIAESGGNAQQQHLAVVYAACPSGHETGTQAPGGSRIRCGRCRETTGRTVLVEVPLRPGEAPPPARPPRRSPQPPPAPPRSAVCRTCGTAADGPPPPGWVWLRVVADPERTRDGGGTRTLGPYCSASCCAAGLHTAGGRAGIRPGPRPGGAGELEVLMTQRPAGRAS